ncbi:MAG: hypothetical protein AAFY71_14540 [Bacteroidota bacterium]
MRSVSIYIGIIITGLSLFSCGQDKVKELESKNSALVAEQVVRDSLLNEFATSFEDFETNLSEIRKREQLIITPQENERRADSKDRILADLDAIDELLSTNKDIIADLNKQVEGAQGKANQFRRMVNGLKKKLSAKDSEIATLKTGLEEANFEVSELAQKITDLQDAIADLSETSTMQTARLSQQKEVMDAQGDQIELQTESINTAYLAVGTSKELKDKNIITKEGAFLGLGGKRVMETEVKETDFVKIDITETTTIPLDAAKKAELVSTHPTDSYKVNENDGRLESIEIVDPEKFWKVSKFLVVVLN